MKKHVFLVLGYLFLIGMGFTGCQKSGSDTPKTKTELITQSSWKFDNAKASGTDVSSYITACQKDNIVTFSSNGSGNVNESTIICSPPTAATFTWTLQSNETVLNISTVLFAGGSSNFNLILLDDTQLVVSQDITISVGVTQNVVVTFKH